MKVFAGTVEIKRDLASYNDEGDAVINLVVKFSKEVYGGIKTNIKKTVVLFKKEAEKANATVNEGDCIFFSDVTRNPRIYETKNNNRVEVVDLVANSFSVVSKTQLKKSWEAIQKDMFTESELTFTAADREACAKQMKKSTKTSHGADGEVPI